MENSLHGFIMLFFMKTMSVGYTCYQNFEYIKLILYSKMSNILLTSGPREVAETVNFVH